MRKLAHLALLGALALAPSAAIGQAQTPAEPIVTMEEARNIAGQYGIGAIEAIGFDDAGYWLVAGTTATGQRITLEIDANSGAVTERSG